MATARHSRNQQGPARTSGANGRRNLSDMQGVLDDTLTGVLNDTTDTKKANTVVAIVGKWMSGVNIQLRALKVALPPQVRSIASLPAAE